MGVPWPWGLEGLTIPGARTQIVEKGPDRDVRVTNVVRRVCYHVA